MHDDGCGDGNAMTPQRIVITMADGTTIDRAIPATLGSPAAPMDPDAAASKYGLCRALAADCDPRIFDDPLGYATTPAPFVSSEVETPQKAIPALQPLDFARGEREY